MDQDLIEIEVKLLVVKYGLDSILKALSTNTNVDMQALKIKLTDLQSKHKKKIPRTAASNVKKTDLDTIELLIKSSPNYQDLKSLGVAFQNKTFLPQIKDVKRFFEKAGFDSRTIKSRSQATKKLFTILRDFDDNEIKKLIDSPASNQDSAFSILSQQIMDGKS